jgi:gamma-glutamyltranspeptidase/glutathione hydrolase
MPFGVMGAHYQPTGQTWFLGNFIDYGLDIQSALDLPRAFYYDDELQLEHGISAETAQALTDMGYRVTRADKPHGGGQAIWRDPDTGLLSAGSDPRKDGCALGY